jgi:hypothetical protein
MSWFDVRHWYQEQDDPDPEPATPCERACIVCKKNFGCIEECAEDCCSKECRKRVEEWQEEQFQNLGNDAG